MTVQRQDTFVRADVPSGLGTATDGNVWTIQSGNGQSVASNKGLIKGSSSSTFATLGAALSGADMEGLVRFTVGNGNTNPTFGLILRWTDSSNHWLARFNGANNQFQFLVKVANTYSTLATVYTQNVTNSTVWLRFRAQGTTVSLKVWNDGTSEPGSWTITATDTRQNVGGRVGLYGFADGATIGTSFDNFSVDDLAVGGTTQNGAMTASAGAASALAGAATLQPLLPGTGAGDAGLTGAALRTGTLAASGQGDTALTAQRLLVGLLSASGGGASLFTMSGVVTALLAAQGRGNAAPLAARALLAGLLTPALGAGDAALLAQRIGPAAPTPVVLLSALLLTVDAVASSGPSLPTATATLLSTAPTATARLEA